MIQPGNEAPIISCQSHHCICFYFIFVKHIRDMKERLQQLLQDKKLSANKLAEMLGIQPSGISHILAGRNKPSIDFVTKLLLAFPDLNPDWFILGTGSMCRTQSTAQPSSAAEAAESATSTSHQPPHPVIPAVNTTHTPTQTNVTAQSDTPDTPAPHNSARKTAQVDPSTSQGVLDFSVTDLPGNDPVTPFSPQPSTSPASIHAIQRQIRRVMIFYTDHTVESFDYTDR